MAASRPSQFPLTTPGPLRLYSMTEMLKLPPPSWLVKGVMTQGGLVGLYGPPGHYKSFVAVDFAMSVATGTPWQARPTKKEHVVYVAAEGGTGIGMRAYGWLLEHNLQPTQADIVWLTESMPVAIDSENMDTFFNRINNELNRIPGLIVIDTLARCFDGDENQQEDMGRFIGGVDRFRREFGATVLVVHHTRLDADRERGSTAFRGAADAMISVHKNGNDIIEVTCSKQKDAEEFEPYTFERRIVQLPVTDEDGVTLSTVVLSEPAGERNHQILTWLRDADEGLTFSELKALAAGGLSGSVMSPAALKRRLVSLREKRQITKENGKYHMIQAQ